MARFIIPSFNKGEVSPELYGRVDTQAYVGGLATARNVHVHSYGGVSRRPGSKYIGPVKTHTDIPRLIEFQFNVTDSYILELGDLYMRVIRDDGHVLTEEAEISGATKADPVVITTSAAHGYSTGDEVYIGAHAGGGEDVSGMTELNRNRYTITVLTTDTFSLQDQVTGEDVNGLGFGTWTADGTVNKIYELVTPWAIEDVFTLNYTQSADTMTIVHPDYDPRELTRSDHDNWSLSTITLGPNIGPVTSLTADDSGATGGVTFQYAVTAVDLDTGEESEITEVSEENDALTIAAGPDTTIALAWTASSGAGHYLVYRRRKGAYRLLGRAETNSYNDNESPDSSLDFDRTPPIVRDPFASADEDPGAVGFFQQRRVFGGSNLDPDTSHYSQTASFSNFNYSNPLQDDDAIQATLNSQQVNQIRHYVGLNDLLIFTSGSEWRVNGGTENVFSPTTIRQFPQSNWGCSYDPPIVIGNIVLFVTQDMGNVRSLGYSLEIDGYKGNNLNVLSRHLIQGRLIADWAYYRVPDPRIYIVLNDGKALTLTFDQEQNTIAWTRMDTLGDYEAVACLRGGGTFSEDSIYWVIKRKVNGNTVRYIEVMRDTWFDDPEDCFFVDSGLSLNVPLTITGVTSADPVVVTSASHGLSNGDEVDIHGIVWETSIDPVTGITTVPDHLNGGRFKVANVTANTFELTDVDDNDIDGSEFADYSSGGKIREAIDSVTGLEHLEGKEVVCLCNGNVITGKTVSDGAISFDRKFSRIHIGLPSVAEIETLNIEQGQGTIQGMLKKVSAVSLKLFKTRGLLVGPDEDNLVEMKQREDETWGSPTSLFTGEKRILLPPSWNSNGRIFIRQKNPLPLTVLAAIPELELEDG